ncbi:thyroid receptor-interacting protein 11-like isoform X2 [Odontomachus brunneus]|uniref:thyroid receptor-interacting protein 11-like isoform X2 n=1 Tax=Odontomachus brunneus TaxID=486640 RepID=UPI0013F1FBB0|nr:thyroid receptor-interacting protein 11-like isoform X2 [Odontomachus brunneus]
MTTIFSSSLDKSPRINANPNVPRCFFLASVSARERNERIEKSHMGPASVFSFQRDTNHNDETTEGMFWDPSCDNNRNARNQNHVRQLQEQLAQATVKVRELECELKRVEMVNCTSLKDDIPDGHRRAEVLRAKQDMLNRIIQIEEKTREAERNVKRIQLDEATLVSDFRSIMSKLNSREKFDLVSGALKALQIESETCGKMKGHEKSDSDEKLDRLGSFEYNPLKHHFDMNSEQSKQNNTNEEQHSTNKEEVLRKRIEELENKNKDLLETMEKLDEEHSQSIEELLSLKQEANRKYRSLQSAHEQLSTDYNEIQKEIIKLRNNDTQILDKSTNKLDKHIQVILPCQGDDSISETSVLNDISEKVKAILRNCTISSVESGESIFEAIAKQYVDAKWKLDVLERKVTEITRNLKETEDMKDALQMDCEELQSHIDSLLMENQALKLNLPPIPEASEERVASLETDVESLSEEVQRLLAENKTIRETNLNLTRVVQNKELSSTSDNQSKENINREIHSCSEENKELQEEIVLLKDTAEQKEFLVSLKKAESSNEDHENIKQKLELEELGEFVEDDCRDINIYKIIRENKDLLKKQEHLKVELQDWQKRDLQKEYNSFLSDLQQQLDKTICEKFNLQNRIILCKENDLDEMLTEIDTRESQLAKLYQDNDRLIKENASLSEQLAATHDESLDKIELLNTEMSLLQQEHEDLKQEESTHKGELTHAKEKLHETQEHYARLENECGILKTQCEQLEIEKGNIQSTMTERVTRIQELEKELSFKESVIGELNFLRNKCQLFEQEREALLSEFPKTSSNNLTYLDQTNEGKELGTIDNNLVKMVNVAEEMKAEMQDLATERTNNATYDSNKQQTLEHIIDEERREKDIVKEHNEKLTNEIIELRSKLQAAFESNKESTEMAKQTIENLSHIIRDKDNEISVLRANITNANNVIEKISNKISIIGKRNDELEQLVTVKHNETLRYQDEIQQLICRLNEQAVHIQTLISEQTMNEMRSKENIEENNHNKIENQIAEHHGQRDEIAALNEKCAALEAALIEEQSNNRILRDQLTESQSKGTNANKELERLRTHLVEMESSYTEEALIAEKNREELETKLLQAEEKVKNSSIAYTSANIRANQQVETLQQQMALIIQQRDQIQAKLSTTEDNILLQSASLTNLQIVLEQFQQTKEHDIMSATEKIRSQLNESYEKQKELTSEILVLKQQLFEAKECLQAASRLSEQLEKKDEQIERLNEEVVQLTTLVNTTNQQVKETMERDEGKVDKTLVKNLLLGYLSSTTSNKSSILRVFATVLDFTDSEKDKTGLNNATTQGNWLLRADKGGSALLKSEETSLTTAFVRFLESESKPKPQLPALPILNSPSSRPGYNKQQSSLSSTLASSSSSSSSSSTSSSLSSSSSSSLSTQSTLLLSNVALPTFPDFVPARNTGSILKEVLKDS